MFDLSWVELAFVAILAIVVVGPRDMPRLIKTFSHCTRKVKSVYGEFQAGLNKLEKEIDIAQPDHNRTDRWENYLPEGVQRLPENFLPGQTSAEEMARVREHYKQQVEQAKSQHQKTINHSASSETPDGL